MIKALGLIKKLANSIGININLISRGTPGGQKIWPQKWPLVLNNITKKGNYAKYNGKSNISGNICRAGEQPKKGIN